MNDIAAAITFLGFLTTAVILGRSPNRQRVSLFLVYALAVTFGVGLTQRDLWPFVSWPLIAGTVAPVVSQSRYLAVDAEGREHDIDYRAWYPISFDELLAWSEEVLLTLDADQRQQALGILLGRVEAARRQALRTGRVGAWDRWLGPATAPFFLLHPSRWTTPESTPSTPFVRLRYYRETWSPELLARGRTRIRRRLLVEYPAGDR